MKEFVYVKYRNLSPGLETEKIIYRKMFRNLYRCFRNIDAVYRDGEADKKTLITLIIVIFIIGFLFGWFLRCYICPCSWAKTSLTVIVAPESQVRGGKVIVSGALIGDDIANKTIVFVVTDPHGTLLKTFNTTTNIDGFYTYTYEVAPDRDPGKYTITASYETLRSNVDVFVELAAPQEHGQRHSLPTSFDQA